MYFYEIFGGCLQSAIRFPELRTRRRSRADWTLERVDGFRTPGGADLLGTLELGKLAVRLYRCEAGFRYESDDTGCFDIRADGRSIHWSAAPAADPGLARIDLLNRVLPLALHSAGTLCLHGSGVVLDQGAVCFLAPKYHGKSTLAMALTARGAALLSDDTLAVELGARPRVRPGVHGVRLWQDSAARFSDDTLVRVAGADGKQVLSPASATLLARRPARLAALYLLAPRHAAAGRPPAERTRLEPVMAAMALVGQSRLGMLFDSTENARVLHRVAALTDRVPVFRLAVDRDLDRLDRVAEQVMGWHTPRSVGARAAQSRL